MPSLPSAATIVADITTLQAQVAALQASLPTPQYPTYALSTDGKSLLISQAGVLIGTFTLPVYSTWAGAYTVGNAYVAGNMVSNAGSTYYCTVAFTASTFAADLAAGNIVVQALAGSAGWTPRGVYSAGTTYNVGDGVILAAGTTTVYVLVNAAPAGTAPVSGSAYWAIGLVQWPMPSSFIHDATQGANLDTIIANIFAAGASQSASIAANATAIALINSKLHTAMVTGF